VWELEAEDDPRLKAWDLCEASWLCNCHDTHLTKIYGYPCWCILLHLEGSQFIGYHLRWLNPLKELASIGWMMNIFESLVCEQHEIDEVRTKYAKTLTFLFPLAMWIAWSLDTSWCLREVVSHFMLWWEEEKTKTLANQWCYSTKKSTTAWSPNVPKSCTF